jgi:hypothetical protein
MRRTFQETQELVAARIGKFVTGEDSEEVLRASLKAMGLLKDEIEEHCVMAAREYIRVRRNYPDPVVERMKDSIAYLDDYLKGQHHGSIKEHAVARSRR